MNIELKFHILNLRRKKQVDRLLTVIGCYQLARPAEERLFWLHRNIGIQRNHVHIWPFSIMSIVETAKQIFDECYPELRSYVERME